ncbi:MAG: hypothetical protein J7K98_04295, partial [Candidatus Aenigmarchaeota archaeon]|nr:hypothetical protein [Candidatus Aenigmarchaeota archaeon]
MKYIKGKVVGVEKHGNLFILRTDLNVKTEPGQFFMIRTKVGEKPFSPFKDEPLSFLIKVVGRFTKELSKLKEGDEIWVRGPYGKGTFPRLENVCLIGGGTGIAPLMLFALKNDGKAKGVAYGCRTKDELILKNLIDEMGMEAVFSTDDGSFGEQGFLSEVLRKKKEWLKKFDAFFVCGPEKMMVEVCKLLEEFTQPKNVYCSLERYVKCGIGLCGSCDFGGYR